LRNGPDAFRAAEGFSEGKPMVAIGVILLFVIGVGLLNWYEFGRPD
jgi:hypothetical protein